MSATNCAWRGGRWEFRRWRHLRRAERGSRATPEVDCFRELAASDRGIYWYKQTHSHVIITIIVWPLGAIRFML